MQAMRELDPSHVQRRLAQSFALDRLWRETMGLPEGDTKEPALRRVAQVLEASGTPYALIGGVAMQLHLREPRTTLDIDLAVRRFAEIPHAALAEAGFTHEGKFAHSDNWRAPGEGPRAQRTAVQFSAEDVGIDDAVRRARLVTAGDFQLRVAEPGDLIVLKLAAAEEGSRRPSKRRQDLMDIVALSETYPEATRGLSDLERQVQALVAQLMVVGSRRGPET